MMNNKNIIVSLCAFVLFMGLLSCSSNSSAPSENLETMTLDYDENITVELTQTQLDMVGIEVGYFEEKPMSELLRANGFLKVPNKYKANATSMFGGVVQSLKVESGDMVKKGQVIALISNPEFIQLQEEYLSIQSQITYAEQELQRQIDLAEGNVGAKKNLQSAHAEMNKLNARKSSLFQQLKMMGIQPNQLNNQNLQASLAVRSPIQGVVSEVFAKIGSYVDVASPIAEIVENSALHMDLQVFEKDIASLKIGQKVEFVLTNAPEKNYEAEIITIGSSFNGDSKSITVHCKINGDKTGLIDGMNTNAVIALDDQKSIVLPNNAIANAEGKYYIFLVNEEQTDKSKGVWLFDRIEIIPGASNHGYTAIQTTHMLNLHQEVVIKGAYFVNAQMMDAGDHAH